MDLRHLDELKFRFTVNLLVEPFEAECVLEARAAILSFSCLNPVSERSLVV